MAVDADQLFDRINQERRNLETMAQEQTDHYWRVLCEILLRHARDDERPGDEKTLAHLVGELAITAEHLKETISRAKRAVAAAELVPLVEERAKKVVALREERDRIKKEYEERVRKAERALNIAEVEASQAHLAPGDLGTIARSHRWFFEDGDWRKLVGRKTEYAPEPDPEPEPEAPKRSQEKSEPVAAAAD